MRPIIGMLVDVDNDKRTSVLNAYASALEKAGGTPIILPYTTDLKTIDSFINLCHGFCFTGGKDIEPSVYNEEKRAGCGENEPYRDEYELLVFSNVVKTQKPILGICRGAQLINVAMGGTLYQDIPSEYKTNILHKQAEPKFSPSHSVFVKENTPLFNLLNKSQITANSFHHQAIKTLGKGLQIMASASDGIIEALYMPEKRFLWAIQWHPERLVDTSEDNKALFTHFIESCK